MHFPEDIAKPRQQTRRTVGKTARDRLSNPNPRLSVRGAPFQIRLTSAATRPLLRRVQWEYINVLSENTRVL